MRYRMAATNARLAVHNPVADLTTKDASNVVLPHGMNGTM